MDSKLEAHIDEIFQDVPKTEKMVTMINRIKSKANTKYLETRDQGYSRSVAFKEVDDWLVKAQVIINEEVGKLTPAEIASVPKTDDAYHGEVVSSATIEGEDSPAIVVERDESVAPTFDQNYYEPQYEEPQYEEPQYEEPQYEEVEEAEPVVEEPKAKKEKKAKNKKNKKDEVPEDEVEVPVKSSGKVGKILGGICIVAGIALIVVAILFLLGIIA